ncbi:MAG: hypothetical protein IT385_21160 [Deltaproteobacteria bacterium]|nr:hypothetical protein [Deltaproteobacteria bacterium]
MIETSPSSGRARGAAIAALLMGLAVAPAARAEAVHLPLAGLVVDLEGAWTVASTWSASADPHEPARGVDLVTRADGERAYEVHAGGRTDRPCPQDDPFVVELDGRTWIHAPASRTLCRLEDDARIEVRIALGPDAPEDHRGELAAFADALTARRIDPAARPPLRDPRVSRDASDPLAATPDVALALDVVGLTVRTPDDGFVWRVARPREGRPFDALVRVFPTFPEVQLLVYRHARRHLASCPALTRRQAARATWRVDELAGGHALVRSLGRFRVVDRCVELPSGLIEVRVAGAPEQPMPPLEPMLAALADAARAAPAPPRTALVPARSHTMRWGAGVLAMAMPETSSRLVAGVELGMAFVQRNGLFARAMAALGGHEDGAWSMGAVDFGVALGAAPELTLTLSLGLREEDDPILTNRSLSLSLELHSGFHLDDAFGWALRVVTMHLASRQPSVAGTPLVIAWDGVFGSGLMLGLDLRWVDRPDAPREGWPGAGLVLGVRFGFADVLR